MPSVSNRAFGLLLGGILTVAGLSPLLHARAVRWWAIVPALGLFALAVFAPATLGPAKSLWMRLAHLLSKIMTHVVCALLLYIVFAPLGFFFRLRGTDLLRLRWEHEASTYWIPRNPPGPAPESMINQF